MRLSATKRTSLHCVRLLFISVASNAREPPIWLSLCSVYSYREALFPDFYITVPQVSPQCVESSALVYCLEVPQGEADCSVALSTIGFRLTARMILLLANKCFIVCFKLLEMTDLIVLSPTNIINVNNLMRKYTAMCCASSTHELEQPQVYLQEVRDRLVEI